MNSIHLLYHQTLRRTPPSSYRKMGSIRLLILSIALLALLLTGCSTFTGGDTQSQPQAVKVNVFGTAANHVHSLIALPNNVLLLATHYGLFRSADGGQHWALVAAGPDQGMMTNWLAASPLNQQRLYVMTFPAIGTALKGTLGLYTSADQGRTWKLAITSAQLGNNNFIVQPGNQSPDQVYVYVNVLGAKGLKVSEDAGQHFTTLGMLPFGGIQGLLALPGAPGTLLAYGDEGVARSTDGGMHWGVIPDMSRQAVFGITTGGPNRPIYASADQGIYASQDGGKSFTLVHPGASYSSLTASPVDPQLLYGKTASTIFRSIDGGHTWSALPPPTGSHGSLYALAADPTNSALLYLGLSYPTEVYRYNQDSKDGKPWTSLTPQAEPQADTQQTLVTVVCVISVVVLAVLLILFRRYAVARRLHSEKGQ
jgi:photosystem II stability/assembly factor-like uncharacterized protein/predicted small secreted protein